MAIVDGAAPTEVPREPTATPPAVPTPARGQPQFDGSAVLEIVDVAFPAGQLIGIVRNVSDRDIYSLSFSFNFHDASGAIVQTKYGGGLLYTMPPGSVNLFEVYFPGGVPVEAQSVSIDVEWQDGQPLGLRTRDGIQVRSSEGRDGDYAYQVTGELVNTTDHYARQIAILGIAYSASGRLIQRWFGVVENLPAGGVAPFKMQFDFEDLPEPVGSYEILTEASLEE
jgi:hypothetical protein